MRSHSRLAFALCACLCALVLALLLSALVEGPAAAQSAPVTCAAAETVFLPAGSPATELPAVARGLWATFALLALMTVRDLALPARKAGGDADGRVLRKRRYVRSFYPLFRQELACG